MLLIVGQALLILLAAAGCGPQKEEAEQLFREADDILANSATPRMAESESLFSQATALSGKGDTAGARAALVKARSLLDEAIPEIESARAKIDKAAALNIGDSHRRFLQAKSRALAALLAIEETRREAAAIFIGDPLLQKPETLKRLAELKNIENEQARSLQEAESEARSLAVESPGETGG